MTIVTHERFHQDEATAIVLLALRGKTRYPGIDCAPIRFVSSPQEAQSVPDAFRIGVGGGPFDEHNTGSKDCAADLLARHLGVAEEPAVSRLLEQVRHADRSDEVHELNLATLIKGWHRLHQPLVVLQRIRMVISDLLRDLAASGPEHPGDTGLLLELAEEVRDRHGYSKKRGSKRVADYLSLSVNSLPQQPVTSLANIVMAWQRLYPGHRVLVKRLAFGIIEDAIRINQMYQATYRAYRPSFRRVEVPGYSRPVRMAVERTDNPDIPKAARVRGACIVIIQHPMRRNVQIFTSRKYQLDMSSVVRQLRVLECQARNRPIQNLDRAHWGSAENIPEVPEWYYLQAGQMILNGSDQSSRGIEPTRLRLREIIRVVKEHAKRKPVTNTKVG